MSTDPSAGPTIGILGGMGPAATVDFYDKIIQLTPATTDQGHLRAVIWADPSTPDRSRALLHNGTDPTPWLVEGVRTLAAAGADVIAIPCNTAHAYLKPIKQAAADVPVLDMIRHTCQHIGVQFPQLHRIGLLATTGTIVTGLYHTALTDLGVEVVVPDEHTQIHEVMGAIRAIKAAQGAADVVERLAGELVARGAQAVIGGCTEITMVLRTARVPAPVVDPAQILAAATVAWAQEHRARHGACTLRRTDAPRVDTTSA